MDALPAVRRITIGFALLLSVLSWPALADQRFEELSHTIRQLVDEHQLPSVAVAVARDQRIIWEEGFGWANRELRIAATPHTPYSLASISKPFTATAVMKLVEAKRVELDREVNDYLGDVRIAGPDAAQATVRRVLSHTAGLPTFFLPFVGPPPTIEETIARYARLNSPPGRRYIYSNLGYGVLEHIIERVSGLSYDEFLRREVFLPLGLGSAFVPRAAPPHAAARYDAQDRPLPFYDLAHRGASSVYASAHDLARFGMFHLMQRLEGSVSILSRRSIEEMQRIQTPGSPTNGYGLGWEIHDVHPDVRHVGHTGGMPGVRTVLSLYPAERVVIVILTNKTTDAIGDLEEKIVTGVMPYYRWRLRQLSGW